MNSQQLHLDLGFLDAVRMWMKSELIRPYWARLQEKCTGVQVTRELRWPPVCGSIQNVALHVVLPSTTNSHQITAITFTINMHQLSRVAAAGQPRNRLRGKRYTTSGQRSQWILWWMTIFATETRSSESERQLQGFSHWSPRISSSSQHWVAQAQWGLCGLM